MEPKKNIKKHNLVEPKWTISPYGTIVGGVNNTVTASRTVVLGGQNITGTTSDTVELSQRELMDRINEISNQIHRNSTRGSANWVLMGSEAHRLFDEVMGEHNNVEVGDWKIEDDRYVQDITITPTRSVEYLDLNITFTEDS